jgi:hypothetical protein
MSILDARTREIERLQQELEREALEQRNRR